MFGPIVESSDEEPPLCTDRSTEEPYGRWNLSLYKPNFGPWDSFECDAIEGESGHAPRNMRENDIYCNVEAGEREGSGQEVCQTVCGVEKSWLSARSFLSCRRRQVRLRILHVCIKCEDMCVVPQAHWRLMIRRHRPMGCRRAADWRISSGPHVSRPSVPPYVRFGHDL